MPIENLLIVSVLPEDDPTAQAAIQTLKNAAKIQVIHAFEQSFRPCVGCNACWLVTPGVCAIKDGYTELLKAYLQSDAVLFLSDTALNFVDYRMKNLIDRLLPLVTMYIRIADGQCRHVPRYDKKVRFGLLYKGAADHDYLNRWMGRVMLNFDGESLGAYPIENAERRWQRAFSHHQRCGKTAGEKQYC